VPLILIVNGPARRAVVSVMPQSLLGAAVAPDTGRRPLHTAWMPQPYRWSASVI